MSDKPYVGSTPLPKKLLPSIPRREGEPDHKFLLRTFGPNERSNPSLDKLLQRVFICFTQADSLKHCRFCGKVQNRKHTIQGPTTIDLNRKNLRIILPRVSNDDSFWNFGPIRHYIATPSYFETDGWYYVQHHVACPDHSCLGNEWHEVTDRSGFRKFGRARLSILELKAKIWPELFVMKHE